VKHDEGSWRERRDNNRVRTAKPEGKSRHSAAVVVCVRLPQQ
jgi:hypothetical protein